MTRKYAPSLYSRFKRRFSYLERFVKRKISDPKASRGHFGLSLLFTNKGHPIASRGKLSKWFAFSSSNSYVMSSHLLLGKGRCAAIRNDIRNEISHPLQDNFIVPSTRVGNSKYSVSEDTSITIFYTDENSPLENSGNSSIIGHGTFNDVFMKDESFLRKKIDSESSLDYDAPLHFYYFKNTYDSNTSKRWSSKNSGLQKRYVANTADYEEDENIENAYHALGLSNTYKKVNEESLEAPSAFQRALEKLSYAKNSTGERLKETFFTTRRPEEFHITLPNEDAFCDCDEYPSDEELEKLTLSSLKGFFFKDDAFIKDASDFSNKTGCEKATKDKTKLLNLFGAFQENHCPYEKQNSVENDLELYKDYIQLLNPR